MTFSQRLRGLPCRALGLALYLWGLGVLAGPGSQAQIVVPNPDGNQHLDGPNYIIPPELGDTLGANLLHRFLEFNVNTGDSVTFLGQGFDNIISMLTGDEPSHINGPIRSDAEGTNLFLINPHGIIFGANARLNINGSFHASTADAVRLSDGTVFSADGTITTGDLGHGGRLTVESVAFGFLPKSPSHVGSIVIDGPNLRVPAGQTLSLIGGDITVTGGALLAPSGDLHLISVASPGHVPIAPDAPPPDLSGTFEDFGTIALADSASLSTSGNGGGRIVIRGGQLTVDQSVIQNSNNRGVGSPNARIDIGVTGTVRLVNRSEVLSSSGDGPGGDITVTAHEIVIAEGASITTSGTGTGQAGDVRVHAAAVVTIRDSQDDGLLAGIFSFAGFDSEAGVIHVTGGRLVMEGSAIGTSPNAEVRRGSPRSGNVTVNVGRLVLTGGARIDSSTSGDLAGGTVDITATERASLSGGSVITVGTTGAGKAGNITLQAGQLTLEDASAISSASVGSGDAGTITITADEIVLSNSTVTTNAEQANGGNLDIRAEALRLNHSAMTATVDEGAGGNITVHAELMLLEDSRIIAQASEGQGGNIGIVATGFVKDTTSLIDASSDTGINGTVNIESLIDLSENASQLPQNFAEPIPLFQEPCAERFRGGK